MMDSHSCNLEVELKFVAADLNEVRTKLKQLGASFRSQSFQRDEYFAHPCRDFRLTDEALRIRSINQSHLMTYKGPKALAKAKIREEVEFAIPEPCQKDLGLILTRLGFRTLAVVDKRREGWSISHKGWKLNIELDDVAKLGTFVEIETLARPETQSEAEAVVVDFAGIVPVGQLMKSSYLALLLGQRPE